MFALQRAVGFKFLSSTPSCFSRALSRYEKGSIGIFDFGYLVCVESDRKHHELLANCLLLLSEFFQIEIVFSVDKFARANVSFSPSVAAAVLGIL